MGLERWAGSHSLTASTSLQTSVQKVLQLLRSCPQVEDAIEIGVDAGKGLRVAVELRLGFPSEWMAAGQSPNGVRWVETAVLNFPVGYPVRAPWITLRDDFDRSLAHMQPGSANELPEPCIYYGNLHELLHARGLSGFIDQTVDWLEKAAFGRLIDPDQGWEPVRRDTLFDTAAYCSDSLRRIVDQKGGHAFFPVEYYRYTSPAGAWAAQCLVSGGRQPLNRKTVKAAFKTHPRDDLDFGDTLALLVWAGSDSSGKPFVAVKYQPETVLDAESLFARARDYGCESQLRSGLGWLRKCAANYSSPREWPVLIVLCARRPYPLIGSDSPLELCPYISTVRFPNPLSSASGFDVRPASHRDQISRDLLARLSGDEAGRLRTSWALAGCGSLGSKIAIHLARRGLAPTTAIDPGNLSPHNSARHALLPTSKSSFSWIGPKADALSRAIEGLGQATSPLKADLIELVNDKVLSRRHVPKKDWAIVNATASLAVREALGSVPAGIEIPRVIETSLFSEGTIGLVSIEGPSRNPNTGDLIAVAYQAIQQDPVLSEALTRRRSDLEHVSIGQGCSSATMPLSDGRLSMLAAPMAELIANRNQNGLSVESGEINLGLVESDGFSVNWRKIEVSPFEMVSPQNGRSWSVRISEKAGDAIRADIEKWPGVETGGVLVGRHSEACRAFYVVDVIEAPPDSERSAACFVLGKKGLRSNLSEYWNRSGQTLYCLGTWHSHLRESGPSAMDRECAKTLALARLAPSVLLIHTPSSWKAQLAES